MNIQEKIGSITGAIVQILLYIFIIAFVASLIGCSKEEEYCECVVNEVVNHKAAIECLDGYHIIYNELGYEPGDCVKLN